MSILCGSAKRENVEFLANNEKPLQARRGFSSGLRLYIIRT